MKLRPLIGLALIAACGSDSLDIEPGKNLNGAWLGCANVDCSEATLAGMQLEDGRVHLIRGIENDGEVERCVYDDPIFGDAELRWEGEQLYLRDVVGIGDLELSFEGDLLEVPAHEHEPGFIFLYPSEYPDSEWMKRTDKTFPDCARSD
jgi:hypothetical protein